MISSGGYEVAKGEREGLRGFLRQSSAGVYGNGWKKWLSYLLTLEGRSHPGERMERVAGADERAERLVLFYQYLYKALGQREEQVATISSALRFKFETRGVNAEFFGLPLAVAGRRLASGQWTRRE
jgi:hypothetical protein